jgi:hypothetical protein
MEEPRLHSQLVLLERRLHRTERWVVINRTGWFTLSALVVLLLWTNSFGAVQAKSQKLRLRELDIVDEEGRSA